ncbi:MAG: polysaccharide deacetylase family protein [Campylobacteraceae bacterium]
MRYIFILCISSFYLFADAHIFIYHRFNDDRYPTTSVTNEVLREHFTYLKDNNYTVIPLKDIVNKIEANESIPDKWIALTIDDGYKSFIENGLAIFKEFNYPFSVFIYVEATEKKYSDFLTWDDIKNIKNEGGDIEYHSYSHAHMTRMNEASLKEDFKKGIDIFEKNLGFKPKYFSYPYGEFNENTLNIAKEFGFSAILNQNSGAITKNSDIYSLDRPAIVGETNLRQILSQKFLEATWFEPKVFPKDGNLTKIDLHVNTNSLAAKLYITGLGWRDIKVQNGTISEEINEKLTNKRTRIIVRVGNSVSTKIITKDN